MGVREGINPQNWKCQKFHLNNKLFSGTSRHQHLQDRILVLQGMLLLALSLYWREKQNTPVLYMLSVPPALIIFTNLGFQWVPAKITYKTNSELLSDSDRSCLIGIFDVSLFGWNWYKGKSWEGELRDEPTINCNHHYESLIIIHLKTLINCWYVLPI